MRHMHKSRTKFGEKYKLPVGKNTCVSQLSSVLSESADLAVVFYPETRWLHSLHQTSKRI